MNDEYIKARDAKVIELVQRDCGDAGSWPERTISDAADWGRAWESPAVCRMVEALRVYAAIKEDPWIHRVKNVLLNKDLGVMARAVLKQYDVERAKAAE